MTTVTIAHPQITSRKEWRTEGKVPLKEANTSALLGDGGGQTRAGESSLTLPAPACVPKRQFYREFLWI